MLKHRNIAEPGHPEKPDRISNIFACHADYGLLDRVLRLEGRNATEEELKLVHTEEHVELMKMTQSMPGKELYRMQERLNSVYFNNNSYESAVFSAGSVLEVVETVLNGKSQTGVAIVRPPGHHAESDEACGFCLFNNVAIAAKYALDMFCMKRILILDWDVHHGNGIQRMFENDPRVLYISIHRYDYGGFFPCSSDADYKSVGVNAGEGFNVNIPWNKSGMGDTEYLAAFTKIVLPIAYQFNPELVLVSAGFDAAKGDPLGGCKVTPEGYAHMTHMLSSLANGKIVLALEGGYNLTSIAYSMVLCTKALLGDPLPLLTVNKEVNPSALQTFHDVIRIQSRYWSVLSPFLKTLPAYIEGIVRQGKYITPESKLEDFMENLKIEESNIINNNDQFESGST
jgi:histone deacetylase 6